MSFFSKLFGKPQTSKLELKDLTDKEKRLLLDFPTSAFLLASEPDIAINFPEASEEAMRLLRSISQSTAKKFHNIRSLSDKADKSHYPKDVEIYKDVLKKAPFDAISTMSIGSSLWNAGRKNEAYEWFKKAYNIDPSNHRVKKNYMGIKGALGK